MKSYETIFIANSDLNEEAINNLIAKMKDVVVKGKGEVLNIQNWGNRKLAYEIKKHKKGHYVLMNFNAPFDLPKELERNLRYDENIIKFLVTKAKPVKTKPAKAAKKPKIQKSATVETTEGAIQQ